MPMLSLKSIASSCLGLSGSFSVLRDFFGYIYGRPNRDMSVRRQMELAKGQALNLSIIWVGWHPNPSVSQVTDGDKRRVMSGLQKMRDIYGQVDLGIRKIYDSYLTPDSAGSKTFIDNYGEAHDLTDDFYAANDGLDVFWVPGLDSEADGWGPPSAGPCDKDAKDQMTGVVCELGHTEELTGVLVAHEVGHYLGLGSGTSSTNFMGVDSNNDGIDTINPGSTGITSGQGNTMKSHCYVKPPCA